MRGVIGSWLKTKMMTSITIQEGLYLAIHCPAGTGLALMQRLYPRDALIEGVMGIRNPFWYTGFSILDVGGFPVGLDSSE